MIPLPAFIHGVWFTIGAVTLVSVVAGSFFGLRGTGNPVRWRIIKLISTLSGVIGIMFLMFSFEAMARGMFAEPSPVRILSYVGMKSTILSEMVKKCGPAPDTPACFHLTNFNEATSYLAVRDGTELPTLESKHAPAGLDGSIDAINRDVRDVNMYAVLPQNRYETFSNDLRIKIFLFAGIFLGIALGGSVGEAAFQLRQALDAQSRQLA